MIDKGLYIFLTVLFGMGGTVILVLVWVRPMPLNERILAASIGSIGLLWTLARAPSIVSILGKVGLRRHLPGVQVQQKRH